MKEILIKDIIRECNARLIIGDENLKIENFSKDTREINENDCYIGIKGETFDGNLFYEEAFKKGASACILEKESVKDIDFKDYNGKTIIIVDNSIKFLQELAAYKRSLYDIPVIAVTGSVGKTSTKEIISSVLSTKYNVLKTEGNYNNHIGLPLTILKLKEHNAMVLEMGMNHLNEINLLSKIAKPTIAVITNIGTAHIGNLGSRENILKAKLEIIDGLKENGTLIINNDNDMLHNNLDKINVNIKTIGINNRSDYMATNIVDKIFSSKFKIKDTDFEVNAPGEAFIYNSLVAYAVGKELNISDENIKKGIENFKLPSNRLEKIVNKTGTTIINDTYNCSYDSLINSIDMISKSNYNRKLLMIGDILELGDYSEDIHRKIGNYILNKDIDGVILVGNEVKFIKDELIKNNFNKDINIFNNESDSHEFLKNYLKKDDIILLKGSNGMKLFNTAEYLKQI